MSAFLLPSEEDVSTTSPVEAQRWSDFYRQLSSFDQTVRSLKLAISQLAGEPRRRAAGTILPGLIGDAEQFARRFDFWEARLASFRTSTPG